jgi:hypothetical protein
MDQLADAYGPTIRQRVSVIQPVAKEARHASPGNDVAVGLIAAFAQNCLRALTQQAWVIRQDRITASGCHHRGGVLYSSDEDYLVP